jgi:hypothetical protein
VAGEGLHQAAEAILAKAGKTPAECSEQEWLEAYALATEQGTEYEPAAAHEQRVEEDETALAEVGEMHTRALKILAANGRLFGFDDEYAMALQAAEAEHVVRAERIQASGYVVNMVDHSLRAA